MKKKPMDIIFRILTLVSAALAFLSLVLIIAYILINGVPYLKPSLFALKYTTDNVSLLPSLITTVILVLASLVITVPIGIFTAIYLNEYANKNNRLIKIIRMAAETLSGIPSIVYGLFGLLLFVTQLGWGFSMISGTFTISIMILPLIMRTAEESLKLVPDIYREGAFGLGAGKLRTVFRIVLPSAMSGILAGIILAVGRIVGETAALIYTAGSVAKIPNSPMESGRTLAVHMYALSSEGLHTGEAYATAVVLLILVVGINALSAFVARRITKGESNE